MRHCESLLSREESFKIKLDRGIHLAACVIKKYELWTVSAFFRLTKISEIKHMSYALTCVKELEKELAANNPSTILKLKKELKKMLSSMSHSSISYILLARFVFFSVIENEILTLEEADDLPATFSRGQDLKIIQYPLSYSAVVFGHFSYLEYLLENGFDFSKNVRRIRYQSDRGAGIISYLAYQFKDVNPEESLRMINLILESENTKNKERLLAPSLVDGVTALDCAILNDRQDLIQTLEAHGAKPEDSLWLKFKKRSNT